MTAPVLAPYPTLTGSEPCRQENPELWFSDDPLDRKYAADLCRNNCPVRSQCLAYALDHPKETAHGIWAATTPRQRTVLRNQFAPEEPTA